MRIALVGLGEAGFTIHLPALAAMPTVQIVGACDPDDDRKSRAARRFGVPVFADFDAMVAAGRPDVIAVATPPDTHADYCLRALGAGAHVICEKPFVASLDEADRVLDAAARAGRGVAVNHQFGEMPIFRVLRDEALRAGGPLVAQIWQLVDLPPWGENGWRGRMQNRALYEVGAHLIDFALTLFGETPVSVQASMSSAGRGDHSEAVAVATLEFSRGRLAVITQNRVCKGERQYFEVRADTSHASLRASFGGRSRVSMGVFRSRIPHLRFEHGMSGLAWTDVAGRRTMLARNPKDPMIVATRTIVDQALAAFASGRGMSSRAERARDGLEVIAACYESAATGQRLRLDTRLRATLGSRLMR